MKFRELLNEAKQFSAGLLLYKKDPSGTVKVFIVHPGGPFFKNKDAGHWSIPKGGLDEGEDAQEAAQREFVEETGIMIQFLDDMVNLGTVKMKSGKIIQGFAYEGDGEFKRSNTFELEWPKDSGRIQEFPEIDKGEWFTIEDAKRKIHPVQIPFLERLIDEIQ